MFTYGKNAKHHVWQVTGELTRVCTQCGLKQKLVAFRGKQRFEPRAPCR